MERKDGTGEAIIKYGGKEEDYERKQRDYMSHEYI